MIFNMIGAKKTKSEIYTIPDGLITTTIASASRDTATRIYSFSDLSQATEIYDTIGITKGLTFGSAIYNVEKYTGYLSNTQVLQQPTNLTYLNVLGVQISQFYDKISSFYNLSKLTSVYYSSALVIGSEAFASCSKLKTAIFPDVTDVYKSAFLDCKALNKVELPVCSSIQYTAFMGCTSLSKIDLPACTRIGSSAFKSCYTLSEITLPVCQSIFESAFAFCSNLTKLVLPSCNMLNSDVFVGTPIEELTCGELTILEGYQVRGLQELKMASFPKCSKISGPAVFRSCLNLISLYLMSSSVVSLTSAVSYVFSSTPIFDYSSSAGQYGTVYVPASLEATYKNASYWKSISSRIVGV